MSEHRGAVLGSALRRYPDPAQSTDPMIVGLLEDLGELEVSPPMRPHFRAELRAQLVAITPRIIAETAEAEKAASATAKHAAPGRHGARARWRRIPIARPLGILTAVVVVFALLLGGAVVLSRKALPGDTLYGLKRAGENVQLDFASSNSAKAKDYLKFAGRRVDEARALLGKSSALGGGTGPLASGGVNPNTVRLAKSALASADSDVTSANTLLRNQAQKSSSVTPLDTLTNWAPSQQDRLTELWKSAPPVMKTQAANSKALITNAVASARKLQTTLRAGGKGPTPGGPATSSAPGNGRATGSKGAPAPGGAGTATTKAGGSAARTSAPAGKPSPSSKPSRSPIVPAPSSTPAPLLSAGPGCIDLLGIKIGDCSSSP